MKNRVTIFIGAILVIFGIVGGVFIRSYLVKNNYKDCYTVREAAHLLSYINMSGGGDITVDLPELYDGVEDEEPFTAKDAREVLDYLGIEFDDAKFSLSKMRDKKALTKEEFLKMFDYIVLNKPNSSIAIEQLMILDISQAENSNADSNVLFNTVATTQSGEYLIDTDINSDMQDKVIDAYVSNDIIILSLGESDKAIRLNNAWVENIGEYVNVFYEGFHKMYPCNVAIDNIEGVLADLVINNEGVRDITLKQDVITSKVLAVSSEGIILEGYDEILPIGNDYRIYKVYGELASEKTSKILVGYTSTSFVLVDGVIEAALITEQPIVTNIRVAINTSDFGSLIHKEIRVSSDEEYTITYGNKQKVITAGEELDILFSSEFLGENGRCEITSNSENGKIKLNNVIRSQGVPAYRGTIEISKYDDGMVVINEVPLEEYLYSVVPSEMPYSYGIEALKAQAMCARGYAYDAMLNNSAYAKYGAHLEDSVNSQVYNNYPEADTCTFAVKDTYGIVPIAGEDIISAYFFSTSCGTTCNSKDVWGQEINYLMDNVENVNADDIDLSNNDRFRMFIDDSSEYNPIEKDFPFYRWNVTFTKEELSEAVNYNLKSRIEANPNNFIVITPEGDFVRKSVDTIGEVTKIEINKRGKSGIILDMTIYGTENSIKVTGQTNARAILCSVNATIVKNDNQSVTGWSSLPSAFYYISTDGDNFTVHGGGFGHGVGMSQNGAKALADLGYNAEYIIEHYYTGANLMYIYGSGDALKREEAVVQQEDVGQDEPAETSDSTEQGEDVNSEDTTEQDE